MEFLTKPSQKFDLPKPIERLGELAYNLWWTWQPEAARLFGRLDYALWERLCHNPIRLLREIGRARLNQAAKDKDYLALYDALFKRYNSYLTKPTWIQKTHPEFKNPIAYFSMEFGLHETLPIYSGGLGVLSGDHLKETSDIGLPLVGVGLLYTEAYFSQRISEDGWQQAVNNPLSFADLPLLTVLNVERSEVRIQVNFPDGPVVARIWEVRVGRTPLYLMDTNIDTNMPIARQLTTRLYWSDVNLSIMQA